MALSEFELHTDRLSTTDEKGRRIFLHPADVRGFYRRHRTRVQAVLILFFLALPWIKIGGQQALLLNIADRHFEIFGLSLRAHNAPLLFFVFAAAGFGLFFATAVLGRVWCGWACPQTVFIDGVFRRIERWIDGPALNRRQLDKEPMSPKKFARRTLKWSLYLAASLIITHSFLAYFVGTEKLAKMISSSPSENWGNFLFMAISTGIILFDFAWFREQFCTIVCPYGRFQSVLMDNSSLVVAYDVPRGEPRATPQSKALAKAHNSRLGDCVNCYRCVQVCPTGIDIRRGVQMECIACTACIDACDEVMTKIKKPTGLIRYDSLSMMKSSKQKIGFRGGLYLTLCILSLSVLTVLIARLQPVEVEILRAKNSPYTVQSNSDGSVTVTNHFRLELSNQSGQLKSLRFSSLDPMVELVTAIQPYPLQDNQVTRADVFFRFPKTTLSNGQKTFRILIQDAEFKAESGFKVEKEVTLVGPFN